MTNSPLTRDEHVWLTALCAAWQSGTNLNPLEVADQTLTVFRERFPDPTPDKQQTPLDCHGNIIAIPSLDDDSWTRHKVDDPMPCDYDAIVDLKLRNGCLVIAARANNKYWGNDGNFTITHWRHTK